MTIPEACQLILQASAIGEGGEIFVMDMGESINIAYLAEQMIRLSGHEPGLDIPIVFTGLRPGEKLHEELFHEDENLSPTRSDKLMLDGTQSRSIVTGCTRCSTSSSGRRRCSTRRRSAGS